jgi:4-hydroxyphenylpyruvate dioxygenase
VSRRQAVDEHGSIEYACIKTSVGNLVHTIIDTSNYSGPYLPGFTPVTIPLHHHQQQPNEGIMSIIDHVAIAVPRGFAHDTMAWYERVLGMARFAINR